MAAEPSWLAVSRLALCGKLAELRDALLINPYDIEQTAEAIRVFY